MASTSSATLSGFNGIDTQSIIDQLVSVEQQKQNKITTRQASHNSAQAAWNSLSAKASSIATTALDLSTAAKVQPVKPTSSDSTRLSVSGTGQAGAAVSLTVQQLASTAIRSISNMGSGTTDLGGGFVTLSTGPLPSGLSSVSSQYAGSGTISVTPASSPALLASSMSAPVTLTSPATFDVTLDSPGGSSTTRTLTLAAGTYTSASQITTAINSQLSGMLARSVVNDDGSWSLRSTREGSYTLSVTGEGAILAGLSTDPAGATASGHAATITSGTTTYTVEDVVPGATLNLAAGLSVTLDSTGHLGSGSASTTTLAIASGATAEDVVNSINSAGAGVSASLTGTGTNAQILVTSRQTGAAHDFSLGWSGFNAGTVQTLRKATDAVLQMGSQTLTRSSNTVTDLMSGVTVTLLKADPATEVTISAAADQDGTVAKVKSFVDAVNALFTTLDAATKVNPADPTKSGPLAGDSQARSLRRSIVAALSTQMSSGSLRVMSQIGVSITRQGSYTLDETKLRSALTSDPTAVTNLLARAADVTDSRTRFTNATADTVAGAYRVSVTQAAERASAVSSSFSSLAAGETLSVKSGALTATYTTQMGMSATQVAAGLAEALKSAGMSQTAEATADNRVRILASNYGAAASFQVTSTGSLLGLDGAAGVGKDVQGTIDGQAASGVGRSLTSTSGSSKGLAITVAALPSDLSGSALDLGTVTYRVGVAGTLNGTITTLRSSTGMFSTVLAGIAKQLKSDDVALTKAQTDLTAYQARLKAQFTAMDTALTKIKSSTPSSFTTGL